MSSNKMRNREYILKGITKIEDKLLMSKILDKAEKSEYLNSCCNSDFLDPYQRNLVERTLNRARDIKYSFYGGYEGAERVIAIFSPQSTYGDEDCGTLDSDGLPFKFIEVKTNINAGLSHRDYLGSLMGLGIKREKIGDILVRDMGCDVIILSEIADYILYNLEKIGNTRVSVKIIEPEEIQVADKSTREIKGTVASLRLDCVAAVGFGVSRTKIAELTRGEKVSINWEISDNQNKVVKEGDTISVRGKGRVLVETIGNLTKKGRISITLKKNL